MIALSDILDDDDDNSDDNGDYDDDDDDDNNDDDELLLLTFCMDMSIEHATKKNVNGNNTTIVNRILIDSMHAFLRINALDVMK